VVVLLDVGHLEDGLVKEGRKEEVEEGSWVSEVNRKGRTRTGLVQR